MTFSVYLIVLLAAALHAVWNALVKNGSNTLYTTGIITFTGAIIAALILPFLPLPARESFFYLGISVVLQILYFGLVAYIYNYCNVGTAYPVMRGMAPLFTGVIGNCFLGEILSTKVWLGILCISGGIFLMVFLQKKSRQEKTYLAILNAAVIAGYTIVDGIGVRLSAAPVAYILWIVLFQGIIVSSIQYRYDKKNFFKYVRQYWYLGLIGGIGMMGSYGLALWAMTKAPIVQVAALRETSILFALMISIFVLKEKITKVQCAAAICIFAGVLIMKI